MSPRKSLRDYLARRLNVPEIPMAMERLALQGFLPELIFDVGAYHGHFAQLARQLWPGAQLTCFEPLPGARAKLEIWAAGQSGVEIHDCLLGAVSAPSVKFHEVETASSVLSEVINHDFPVNEYRMSAIDEIVERSPSKRYPDFIKLDVQGYELEVLKGAVNSLAHCQAVLMETNLLDLHVGVPLLSEVLHWMDARGFVAFDICGLTRRPLDGALWQADLLLVRKDHSLRRDKRYSG